MVNRKKYHIVKSAVTNRSKAEIILTYLCGFRQYVTARKEFDPKKHYGICKTCTEVANNVV